MVISRYKHQISGVIVQFHGYFGGVVELSGLLSIQASTFSDLQATALTPILTGLGNGHSSSSIAR